MAQNPVLSDAERELAGELWVTLQHQVKATVRHARKTWCSGMDEDDLTEESFFVLLSALGYARTQGKFDPEREGQRGKSTFSTFYIRCLKNHFIDIGVRAARLKHQTLSE